jgi:peptidoglycan/LPS O-acetylase OafA/YrhL
VVASCTGSFYHPSFVRRVIEHTFRPWLADQGEPAIWTTFLAFVISAISVPLAYLSYRYIESLVCRSSREVKDPIDAAGR